MHPCLQQQQGNSIPVPRFLPFRYLYRGCKLLRVLLWPFVVSGSAAPFWTCSLEMVFSLFSKFGKFPSLPLNGSFFKFGFKQLLSVCVVPLRSKITGGQLVLRLLGLLFTGMGVLCRRTVFITGLSRSTPNLLSSIVLEIQDVFQHFGPCLAASTHCRGTVDVLPLRPTTFPSEMIGVLFVL